MQQIYCEIVENKE